MGFSETTKRTISNHQSSAGADKFIVKYRHNFYDISEFACKHPGGMNTLKGLRNADMTERFMRAPPHSPAAMYLLNQYKTHTDSLIYKDVKEAFGNGIEQTEEKWNNNHLDENME